MPRKLAEVTLILCLAACAAPAPPGCDSGTARELRTLDRLIAETRRALDTGYREERVAATGGFNFCLGSARSHVGVSFCSDGTDRTRTVAIDPAAETRKLEGLRDRRATLLATHPACAAPE
ncbi:hypothetical protein [Albidovulum sediminis]|uniref:Lysozyme inhibitor LprI N-terminal domain-containing protein n=1 Tax=Albidovulum sediminis TaxID=3066345 RepID=A0ABT2NVD7_9RHOB|nr:hypothetical protein [Defluviimonas sediminis]MCT8331460.1 hypothetical protein [Defluviimonas sediminis]